MCEIVFIVQEQWQLAGAQLAGTELTAGFPEGCLCDGHGYSAWVWSCRASQGP